MRLIVKYLLPCSAMFYMPFINSKPKPIQTVTPQKVEESPPVDDDPNEVMVMEKSNIIYYNDIEADRKIPTRSLPLKEVELPVDKDINPDDVEDNIEPQKGLTEEDKCELMEPEGIMPDPDFDTSMTYEEMNNMYRRNSP